MILIVCVVALASVAIAAPPYNFNGAYNGNYPYFYNGYYGAPYNYFPYGGGFPYGRDGAYQANGAYQNSVEAYPAEPAYPNRAPAPVAPQPAYHPQPQPAHPAPKAPAPATSYEKLAYIGVFKGSCKGAKDGLYYIDNRSFAFCSNEYKTIQNCPEASENPAEAAFAKPDARFCSINRLQHEDAYRG